jgi:hypothetical protein
MIAFYKRMMNDSSTCFFKNDSFPAGRFFTIDCVATSADRAQYPTESAADNPTMVPLLDPISPRGPEVMSCWVPVPRRPGRAKNRAHRRRAALLTRTRASGHATGASATQRDPPFLSTG